MASVGRVMEKYVREVDENLVALGESRRSRFLCNQRRSEGEYLRCWKALNEQGAHVS